MAIYSLHGLNISSDIELLPLPGGAQPVDVHITENEIPYTLIDAIVTRASYAITEMATLINIPQLGRFLIKNKNEIVVAREKGITSLDLLPVLLGPVWAALLHQRGLFPLAGSLIEYNGSGILVCGSSAAGVSTLAMSLEKQGMHPLSDEFCLIQLDDKDVMAQPGIPAMKLWQDTMDSLDLDTRSLQQVRSELKKYWYPLAPSSTSIPLKAIVQLREWYTDGETAGLSEKKGFSAFTDIDQLTWHLAYLRPLPLQKLQFQRCTAVANKVHVLRYCFKRRFEELNRFSRDLSNAIEAYL